MNNSKRLFTPGPLNSSNAVKNAMNIDIGTRTQTMVDLTRNIRMNLEKIAECGFGFTSVLLQGSGTFAVEAMLTSLIPANGFVLIASNGVYGDRMTRICEIHNISHKVLRTHDTLPIQINEIKTILEQEKRITHIAAVQFETALGVLNNIDELSLLAQDYNCEVLVDAMSAFGALSLNYQIPSLTAVAASSNKCLHGVPGIGFVIVSKEKLKNATASRILSLDLKEQWQEFEHSGQWRFTPPTHVLLALQEAIHEFIAAGGRAERIKKYTQLTQKLITQLGEMNIRPPIDNKYRAPIITTFVLSNEHSINAEQLSAALFQQNLVIYPSTYKPQKSFRVGCIGEIDIEDINNLSAEIKEILAIKN